MVAARFAAAGSGAFFEAAARSDIDFASDDRFDFCLAHFFCLAQGHLVEIHRPEHGSVIRQGQCGELELLSPINQFIQPACSVEQ